MHTTALALAALVIGVGLAVAGSLVLARCRAAVRTSTTRRVGVVLAQYPAGAAALAGLVATGAGTAVLGAQILPWRDPVRSVVAATVGVAVFALAGTLLSRIADRTERARVRRSGAAPEPVGRLDPRPPDGGNGQTPSVEDPLSHRAPGDEERPLQGPPGVANEPPSPASGEAASTGVPPGGRAVTAPPLSTADQPAVPAPPATVVDAVAVAVDARPGWIYRDGEGSWFMGVGTTSGRTRLVELPDFILVGAGRPAYPLHTAGAGELAVVPAVLAAEPAEPRRPTGRPPQRGGPEGG